eukprot:346493-Chlamydomonas_euryale.AAC.3
MQNKVAGREVAAGPCARRLTLPSPKHRGEAMSDNPQCHSTSRLRLGPVLASRTPARLCAICNSATTQPCNAATSAQETLGTASDSMLQQLGVTVAINLVYSLAVKNIDNWGHLGGALGGAALAWVLGPRLVLNARGLWHDRPPLPWLAHPEGYGFAARKPARTRPAAPASAPPPASAGQDAASGARREPRKKPWWRPGRGGGGDEPPRP